MAPPPNTMIEYSHLFPWGDFEINIAVWGRISQNSWNKFSIDSAVYPAGSPLLLFCRISNCFRWLCPRVEEPPMWGIDALKMHFVFADPLAQVVTVWTLVGFRCCPGFGEFELVFICEDSLPIVEEHNAVPACFVWFICRVFFSRSFYLLPFLAF